jgi:predicted polyphosphate/ATP-dependent NAD kinase
MPVKRLGLIVNPVAGVGGRVGLKGSDGADIVRRALELGALRESPQRAQLALRRLVSLRDQLEIVTYAGEMGADEARAGGFAVTVAGEPAHAGQTTAADTEAAARALRDAGVELLLFAGGDGTARNVFDAVGDSLAVLGVPAGVKIHSAVFATTPAAAGDLAALYLQGRREALRLREAEVMDIDEDAFRQGRVSARLYGYLQVPYQRTLVQSAKAGGVAGDAAELAGVAHDVVNDMSPATLYLLGPGTTTRAIVEALGLAKTLLGVDAVRDRELVGADLSEAQVGALLDRYGGGEPDGPAPQARIVSTVIGGQGHIFGRGNQQLSPAVIRRVGTDHVIVVATQTKLLSLGGGPLLVDTGDPALDLELGGYAKVVTGLGERMMYRIGAPS